MSSKPRSPSVSSSAKWGTGKRSLRVLPPCQWQGSQRNSSSWKTQAGGSDAGRKPPSISPFLSAHLGLAERFPQYVIEQIPSTWVLFSTHPCPGDLPWRVEAALPLPLDFPSSICGASERWGEVVFSYSLSPCHMLQSHPHRRTIPNHGIKPTGHLIQRLKPQQLAEADPWGLGHDAAEGELSVLGVITQGLEAPQPSSLCPQAQTIIVGSYKGSGGWVALERGTDPGSRAVGRGSTATILK